MKKKIINTLLLTTLLTSSISINTYAANNGSLQLNNNQTKYIYLEDVNKIKEYTTNIPYLLQRVINTIPNSEWIYIYGNNYGNNDISIIYNQNLKELCKNGWNAPDINGTLVCIDELEFFVSEDGTVYKCPHQAYDKIYRYNSNKEIDKEYPYLL